MSKASPMQRRTAYEGRDGRLYESEGEAICSLLATSMGGSAQEETKNAIFGPAAGCGMSANSTRMRDAIVAAAKIITRKKSSK